MSKSKIARERKLIPQLIFQLEQFELAVIRLGKVTKTDLAKYLKRATTRDFKVDAGEIARSLVRQQESEKEKEKGKGKASSKRKSARADEDSDEEDEDGHAPSKKGKSHSGKR